MTREELIIGDRSCVIYLTPAPQYLLIQPVDDHDLAALEQQVEYIRRGTDVPFVLCAFEVNDWNLDLSPWPAPAVYGDADFGGGAADTLHYVETVLRPELRSCFAVGEDVKTVMGGYSLAGLFSLWCGYETDLFTGIAAASPSVWFDGWIEYAAEHEIQAKAVYLSLGDREEKTRNRRMAAVGDCIRKQEEFLSASSVQCTLVWNPGNHFQDTGVRTAKGFVWAMSATTDQ